MTEAEWLASTDPEAMQSLLRGKVSDRRWRLFVCACCRQVWHRVTENRSRRAVEMSERYADGGVSGSDLDAVRREGHMAWYEVGTANHVGSPAENAAAGAFMAANTALLPSLGVVWRFVQAADDQDQERGAQAAILRDIFGNLFRPVNAAPVWLTPTAVALARQMYESRDFALMPILADALQDAGCDDADVLDHCRGAGPHVRGCWVVDALLGKG